MANIIIVAALCILASYANGQACPRIITRAQWGARPASTSALTTFPPSHVVIHHSATQGCTTEAACMNLVRSFQNTHMNVNGWADIGYNYLVGGDGQVYEGRGWGRQGAHTVGFNARSMGICFIGTFTSANPTAAAMNAVQQLISCGVNLGQISRTYRLMGHRQGANTACPGNTLYNTITRWPQWTANP